jgi:hypothetical protein
MRRTFQIVADDFDIGQMLDGLEVRAQAWENTAEYIRTGESPEEFFLAEECSDADEADRLAHHYRSIINRIREQVAQQRERHP